MQCTDAGNNLRDLMDKSKKFGQVIVTKTQTHDTRTGPETSFTITFNYLGHD